MSEREVVIPDLLRRKVTGVYGEAGTDWIARLPHVVRAVASRWSLSIGAQYPDLSYNYVAQAITPSGVRAVLKIGVPEIQQLREAEALRLFNGEGAARLLDFSEELGALLIERLEPATSLATLAYNDEVVVLAAAGVMRALWRPVPEGHPFPTVAGWATGTIGRYRQAFPTGGPYPRRLIDEAADHFDELLPTSAPPVLLHGDLHHDNIRAANRAPWLAIDPKGVVGEPAYEVGALLRNPGSQIEAVPDLRPLLARRIAFFARELDIDPERLRKWGMAQAVLAACWSWEDRDAPPVLAFKVAEALSGR